MRTVILSLLLATVAAGEALPPPIVIDPPIILPPPVLKVPASETPIQLASMQVQVSIDGLLAETTTTLRFRNPNARQLAGDLEFPLPEGAAVCGYALDINGRLVDGVLVTKEKARVVLETEMRRRVDPGIAEHVAGNLFRTRIFPIPANGERTVRVTWVSELSVRGDEAAFHLPLPRTAIPDLRLDLRVANPAAQPEVGGFGNLTLTNWQNGYQASAALRDVTPGDDLRVRLPRLPATVTAVAVDQGDAFFSVSAVPPALKAAESVKPPEAMLLAFDASGGRSAADVARDCEALAGLFAVWRNCEVQLVVFRDRPEAPRGFTVRGGDAQALLDHLRALPLDGGTDLSALDLRRQALAAAFARPTDRPAPVALICTDGLATLGDDLPKVGGMPVHALVSGQVRDAAPLRLLAAMTGGVAVDLAAVGRDRAVQALTRPEVVLQRIEAADGQVADLHLASDAGSGRCRVFGRLQRDGAITLIFGRGGQEVERRTVDLKVAGAPTGGLIARAWAQAQVADLAVRSQRNADRILALGMRHGLVTPGTSLIVLENLQQYLEHRIEPPASWPEMREQYLAALKGRDQERQRQDAAKIDRVVGMWNARVQWWSTEFKVPPGWRFQELPAKAREGREGFFGRGAAPAVGAAAPATTGLAAPAPAESAMENSMREDRAALRAGGHAEAAKKGDADPHGPVAASIAIQPWDPNTPYLVALKAAPAGQAYAEYLRQRAASARSPAFFLDCAGFLLASDKAVGVRVLTNLAELGIDDAALLRMLAWRLAEAGDLSRAVEVLEKVRGLRPEEPQSHRDLALVLADRGQRDGNVDDLVRAARLLHEVVLGTWQRFEEIEVIALMDLNRVLTLVERLAPARTADLAFVDGRLRRLLDLDVRILLSWDADQTDIDLHVSEPSGETGFYGNNRTHIGGLVSRDFTQGYGPEEYCLRRAMPGVYTIRCKYYGSSQQTLVGPATVTATVITNFGRPDEARQVLTLRLDRPHDMVTIGAITIGQPGQPAAPAANASAPTRAQVQALKPGADEAAVRQALGEPARIDGGAVAVWNYRLADGATVRLGLGDGRLLWAREVLDGAERDLLTP